MPTKKQISSLAAPALRWDITLRMRAFRTLALRTLALRTLALITLALGTLALCTLVWCALATSSSIALAQDTDTVDKGTVAETSQDADVATDDVEEDGDDLEEEVEEDEDDGDLPQLRAPELDAPDLDTDDDGDEQVDEDDDEGEVDEDGGDESLLDRAAQSSPSDPTHVQWKAPESIFTLNGYFRTRVENWQSFSLGRTDVLPFRYFVPADDLAVPDGGCGASPTTGINAEPCERNLKLRFANMRLRLAPTLTLSEEVRVHMMFDIFDNMVLGSTPDGGAYTSKTNGFGASARNPNVPLDTLTGTQDPPQGYRNNLRDSIYVRRAWAEITNPLLGQLRFGRMGSHWGLGMLQNGGDGIDSDYSTDVDRIMGVTKLAGIYIAASWDFASSGIVRESQTDLRFTPFDWTDLDDVDQNMFVLAYKLDDEEINDRLQNGDWTLQGGAQFLWRRQKYSTAGREFAFEDDPMRVALTRRQASTYIPDIWAQFRWGSLRLEVEAAFVAGTIENALNTGFAQQDYKLRQFGLAFEGEYRLLDDALGIYFDTGLATGDGDVDGISPRQGTLAQDGVDKNVTHFSFHPNYRVDLIFWRNIMGSVGGAWYLKPGVSYDILRTAYGQVLGARADVIYSRAMNEVQTWGSDPNLGLEIDINVYYRSEDGPGFLDGFYASLQYGVFFPFQGLGYRTFRGVPEVAGGNPGLETAQTWRLILGVQY